MTEESQEKLDVRQKVSERLADLLKQGAAVAIEDIEASRLKALAVYNGMMCSRECLSYLIFKYAVVDNPSITKTTRGNYVLEGEKVSEIWQSEVHNGWFSRKFFGQPEKRIGWDIRQDKTGSLVKLLQEGNAVIPIYE